MPTFNDNALTALFSLPPKRAIAYLKAKGFTFSWDWQGCLAAGPCPERDGGQGDTTGYSAGTFIRRWKPPWRKAKPASGLLRN